MRWESSWFSPVTSVTSVTSVISLKPSLVFNSAQRTKRGSRVTFSLCEGRYRRQLGSRMRVSLVQLVPSGHLSSGPASTNPCFYSPFIFFGQFLFESCPVVVMAIPVNQTPLLPPGLTYLVWWWQIHVCGPAWCCLVSGGVPCPNISALQEVRSCNEHPCTVYHWQTGTWGQCMEDTSIAASNTSVGQGRGNDASCSVGMQTRKVICVRVNVGQVPPKK